MARSVHHIAMKKRPVEQIRIAEFKAHMGEYLQGVREGHPLVLYDRNTPVATLTPYIREGENLHIRKAVKNLKDLVLPSASKHRVDFMKALDAEREDRF